jgi:hypothetical protein
MYVGIQNSSRINPVHKKSLKSNCETFWYRKFGFTIIMAAKSDCWSDWITKMPHMDRWKEPWMEPQNKVNIQNSYRG